MNNNTHPSPPAVGLDVATDAIPIRPARNVAAIADWPTLQDYAVREIAARAGRGWYFADKPRAALTKELQEMRLATYKKVLPIAQMYATGAAGLSQRTRDAIWAHVCSECDIRYMANNPNVEQVEVAMTAAAAAALNADPDVTQAFVAWARHRMEGGHERFEPWRQRWLKERQEATDGQNP